MNLRLRKWAKKDVIPLTLLANNPLISENLRDRFPYPYTLKDAEGWIRLNAKAGLPNQYAIEVDGILAGGCGIEIKQDIYRYTAEVGYWLGQPFWGKGIATEALRQLIELARTTYPFLVRLYAEVFAYNTASMKVLEKNGFYLEARRKQAVIKDGKVLDDCVWVKLLQDNSPI